jgi:hypothetical protein
LNADATDWDEKVAAENAGEGPVEGGAIKGFDPECLSGDSGSSFGRVNPSAG